MVEDAFTLFDRPIDERMACVFAELDRRIDEAQRAAAAVGQSVVMSTPLQLEIGAEVA